MNAPHPFLDEARRRIADCFHGRDKQGRLVQRRDALNLAGLGLTAEEIEKRFDGDAYAETKRGLGKIGFEDLVHLRYLDLTSNKLTRLPRGMASFANLRWLGLNFNQLTSIASEAGDWKELQRLYLRGNKLRTLPESIATWRSLEEVDLAENVPLELLPRVWLDVMAHRKSTNSQQPKVVVELKGSGLAMAFERDKANQGQKLTRDHFDEDLVQDWLRKQKGEPEPVDLRRPSQRDIRNKVKRWTEEKTADALASLALKDESWLFFLENPASLGQRFMEDFDLNEIESEVQRMRDDQTPPSFVHPLWRAWYVTGLRRWREEGEERWEKTKNAMATRRPSDSANPSGNADTDVDAAAPEAPGGRSDRVSPKAAGRKRKTK